jgi:hypothetical protein
VTTQERHERAIAGLGQAIYEETWLGNYWSLSGVLVLEWIRARLINRYGSESQRRGLLSARSSTWYSAAGQARARASKNLWAKFFWFPIAAFCFWRALRFSNRFAKKIQLEKMTAPQLDVRASILRKLGKHNEALWCAVVALGKKEVSIDSRALLLLSAGECQLTLDSPVEANRFFQQAEALLPDISPNVRVRVARALATYHGRRSHHERAEELRTLAREIAEREGLADQLQKIATEAA